MFLDFWNFILRVTHVLLHPSHIQAHLENHWGCVIKVLNILCYNVFKPIIFHFVPAFLIRLRIQSIFILLDKDTVDLHITWLIWTKVWSLNTNSGKTAHLFVCSQITYIVVTYITTSSFRQNSVIALDIGVVQWKW